MGYIQDSILVLTKFVFKLNVLKTWFEFNESYETETKPCACLGNFLSCRSREDLRRLRIRKPAEALQSERSFEGQASSLASRKSATDNLLIWTPLMDQAKSATSSSLTHNASYATCHQCRRSSARPHLKCIGSMEPDARPKAKACSKSYCLPCLKNRLGLFSAYHRQENTDATWRLATVNETLVLQKLLYVPSAKESVTALSARGDVASHMSQTILQHRRKNPSL